MGRSEREAVAAGGRLYEAAQAVAGDHGRAVEAVRAALKPICDTAAEQALDAIPVARLKEVTEGRLRLGEVERSGLYARRSAVAESTPDAVDVSDTAMARQIVEEEQARLGAVREQSAGHS
ncbi:hypothetical protein [Streptomyces sp. ISL-87]|uniref:hypothetical protein n=1 Tax=unclassified Streptomyces TaxID=2593676 RepID=UPI0035AC28FA